MRALLTPRCPLLPHPPLGGPFLISADSDRLFWRVNIDNGYAIEGTRDVKRASPFYILGTEDSHPYDFVIAYRGEDFDRERKKSRQTLTATGRPTLEPVGRYLLTPVNVFGRNSGPLRLHYHAEESHSRLTLHGRLTKGGGAVDLTDWVDGKDVFFINCAQRTMRRDGYICMKAQGRRQNPHYTTACVARKSDHNDRDTWMLFRLVPPSYRSSSGGARDATADGNEEDVELEEYDRVLGTDAGSDDPMQAAVAAHTGVERPRVPMVDLGKPSDRASHGTGTTAQQDSAV